jgi:hypothetical protein
MYYSEKVSSRGQKNLEILTKLFTWPDTGNHFIMIIRGLLDMSGFERIFREITEKTQSLLGCKVLIDLQDATFKFDLSNIDAFVNKLRSDLWPQNNKVALVTGPAIGLFDQLFILSNNLSSQGLKVAIFHNSKDAVIWLAEGL